MAFNLRKRIVSWDALDVCPTKRRRLSSNSHNTRNSETPKVTLWDLPYAACYRFAKHSSRKHSSPFSKFKITPDQIYEGLNNTIKTLKKPKQFAAILGQAELDSERGLFTFKQVQLICENMIKESENKLCELYEALLTSNLTEQYDIFVKFTHDHIQRLPEPPSSYFT
ncbi:akirin-like [Drosophila willistoni]|uniref:akirin-like n=1 Tax=Drosophila willistoni TaxID=7260 RepID=UPI000C26C91F|nr:akirin-like isoform X1 [Drosophila willistoni]XP_046869305.1 akirin-like isoform X1 [Drosophila willistoni]XP_046869306.1 akirin-like [Drosophila willistoni]